jgi:pimeloyl-ACP methyl ester carboxylesterase
VERAEVDGVQLEYQFSGSGTGDPVVFIHGAFIADSFRPLLAEPTLAERYKLITYRRRGYGVVGGPGIRAEDPLIGGAPDHPANHQPQRPGANEPEEFAAMKHRARSARGRSCRRAFLSRRDNVGRHASTLLAWRHYQGDVAGQVVEGK